MHGVLTSFFFLISLIEKENRHTVSNLHIFELAGHGVSDILQQATSNCGQSRWVMFLGQPPRRTPSASEGEE